MAWRFGWLIGWAALACAAPAAAAPAPDLGEALVAARRGVMLGPSGLSGDGAAVIAEAVREARYVGIGEDHFTREIPRLTAALCRMMAPQGLAAYVVEAGPIATAEVAPMLAAPDRVKRLERFVRRYPNAVAFLDGDSENEAAAQCRAAAPRLRLIGIDQEFLGASGMLLDRVLAAPLGPAARRQALALRDEERRDSEAAAASGDPGALFMSRVEPARLDALAAGLRGSGDGPARTALAELRESAAIYAAEAKEGAQANRRRSLLMKRHLVESLPASGKVLLKFGDWHLYKGVNPLEQLDIGNFIAERADGEGAKSLHILVLPVGGAHGAFAGYARQAKPAPFRMSDDKDYRWFALAADRRLAEGWTLYDLRRLRHRTIANVDPDWRRVIDGYDLLIVIPEASAAKLVGYPD